MHLVITLRADFYDRPLLHAGFGQLVKERTEVVLPLTTAELTTAVADPARQAGAELEEGLVTTIVADVAEEAGALPMLQYALTELFARRDGRLLTQEAYRAIGGVTGALAKRAEEVFAGLDEPGQELARQLFLRLVTLGEGVEDTRRRVLRSELEAIQADATQTPLGDIIDTFGRARLLTFDHDPETREPTVEVAHEALLREWPRLRTWLDDSRDDVRLQRLLSGYAVEWAAAERASGYLLRGSRLDQFVGWKDETTIGLTADERAFLDASLAARQQRQAAEEARRKRELETAQQLADTESRRAAEQTQAAESLRRRAVFLGLAMVVAVVLAILAFIASRQATLNAEVAAANLELAVTREADALAQQALAEEQRTLAEEQQALAVAESDRADQERSVALAAQATAEAEAVIRAAAEAEALDQREEARTQASIGLASQALLEMQGNYPERAVPLALEALEEYPYTWQAERALGQAVLDHRIERIVDNAGTVTNAEWSPNGTRIAATNDVDGSAAIWDAQTGDQIAMLEEAFAPAVNFRAKVRWSPDGNRVLTLGVWPIVKIWDAETGDLLSTLNGHEARVQNAVWSPEGDRVLSAGFDGTVRMWDAATGNELLTLTDDNTGWMLDVSWSPNGSQIAAGNAAGHVLVWDSVTGEVIHDFDDHEGTEVFVVAWSPSGDRLLGGGLEDQKAIIWDAVTGEALTTLTGHGDAVWAADWSPDGTKVATTPAGYPLTVWDAESGDELFTWTDYTVGARWWAWSPTSEQIAVLGPSGSVFVLGAEFGNKELTIRGHRDAIVALDWSADGDRLVTGGNDNTFRIWDVSLRAAVNRSPVPPWKSLFTQARWSPTGDRLLVGDWDWAGGCLIRILDSETLVEQLLLPLEDNYTDAIWHPDGQRFFGCMGWSDDPMCRMWDATTGEELLAVPGCGPQQFCTGMAWSPAGDQIVIVSGIGVARIIDVATGEELRRFTGHGDGAVLMSASWSADGQHILTSSTLNDVLVWDAETGDVVLTLPTSQLVGETQIAVWAPDESRIVTFSLDAVGGRIWDASTGELLNTFTSHSAGLISIDFAADGSRMLTGSDDHTARVWDFETGNELLVYTYDDPVAAWYSPDESRIVFAEYRGTTYVVDVLWQSPQELAAYARDCCLIHELTPDEREHFGLPERP